MILQIRRVVQPILSTNKIIRSSQNSIRTPDPTAIASKAVKAVLLVAIFDSNPRFSDTLAQFRLVIVV